MANTDGIFRMMQSDYWKKTIWPPFKKKYPTDAAKVESEAKGVRKPLPASNFAKGIVEELRKHLAAPPPPPPPPPPPNKVIAPRTFNKVLPDGSDARFCITGLPVGPNGPYDQWTTYDNNGLDKTGGRDKDYQVPGLRQANTMDHYGPCDLYDGLTAWPGNKEQETGSYHR